MVSKSEVCTVREAAAAARVSQATIRRLIIFGKLKAMRIGRSVRIERCELERAMGVAR